MEFVRRVYEHGKLTIPKEIREVHDIQEGDFVRLAVVEVVRSGKPLPATAPRVPAAPPQEEVA